MTMDRINQLSKERQRLWQEAGRRELTEKEYWRVQQISRELTKLWDSYRRQRAAVAWDGRRQGKETRGLHGSLLAQAA
jgi:hypothetical protein